MPTSDYRHIPEVLDEVIRLSPKRVIELGIGFGKWGVLLREVLDARYGRCRPDQWDTLIVGIEKWTGYASPAWEVYSNVQFIDFAECPHSGFDLVMLMDSLEHVADWEPLLDRLVANNRHVIVSVPNGPMPQGETFGNPYEAHLTTFHGPEFDKYNPKLLHLGLCRVVSIEGKLK